MFIGTLSTIAKLWRDPKCPSTDEWIKYGVSIQWDCYYSTPKWNEVLIQTTTWTNLKIITLCERSQLQNILHCMIPSIGNVLDRQIYRDRKQISSCLQL